MSKEDKKQKMSLLEILRVTGMKEHELCDVISQEILFNKQLHAVNQNQTSRRDQAAKKEKALEFREQRIDLKMFESSVKHLELKVREFRAKQELVKVEEFKSNFYQAALSLIYKTLMVENVSSGNQQLVNTYLNGKLLEVEKVLGLHPTIDNSKGDAVMYIEEPI